MIRVWANDTDLQVVKRGIWRRGVRAAVLVWLMVTRIKSFEIVFAEDNSVRTGLDNNAEYLGSENSIFDTTSHELIIDKKSGFTNITISDMHVIEEPK
jgi:hypothetical protein